MNQLASEQQRRVILTANMLAVEGKVQREGAVVHIVADKLIWPAYRLRWRSHELASNATKYGSLSELKGQLAVLWAVTNGSDRRL